MASDQPRRRLLPERQQAIAPTKRVGEGVEYVQCPRLRGSRVAVHRDRPDVSVTDPRLEPADQVLVGEHDIEVRTVRWRSHWVAIAGADTRAGA